MDNIFISDIEGKYTAVIAGKAYRINRLYFTILSLMQAGESRDNAVKKLSIQEDLSEHQSKLIAQSFEIFIQNVSSPQKTQSYIKAPITILHKGITEQVSSLFLFLFNKPIFISLFITSTISSLIFIVYTFSYKGQGLSLNASQLWIVFVSYVASLLFHEIGHSTASLKFNQPSKEIGFGFYFIFPVFFSDVTNTWLLSRNHRIIVNLSGIYFQNIINTALIGVFLTCGDTHTQNILSIIIISNFSVVVYSLIPFFRNDGYWIYSDLFNVSNLLQKSNTLSRHFITKSKNKSHVTIRKNKPVVIFTAFNWLFRVYVLCKLLHILTVNISRLVSDGFSYKSESVTTILILCICGIGLYLIVINAYKSLTSNSYANDTL